MNCRNCFVGNVHDKVVLSDGCKINPIVLAIGEAPGADEVLQGKPFVGQAGKLLRSTLNCFGYNKDNTLITNTIPCRPEFNKFPQDNALVMRCVEKWLYPEIEITQPRIILLIGATPLKFLLAMTGITKLRGQWFEYKGIPCMPTFHPSFVIRKQYMTEGPQISKDFNEDIKTVAIRAGFCTNKGSNQP
jgi:DNA polymerase